MWPRVALVLALLLSRSARAEDAVDWAPDIGEKPEGSIPDYNVIRCFFGPPDVREHVATAVAARLPAMRWCYTRALKRAPDLHGLLVVRFTFAADGTVSDAAVKSSELAAPEFEDCVIGQFQKLRLDPPTGAAVHVSYPVRFAPETDASGTQSPKGRRRPARSTRASSSAPPRASDG